MSEQSADSDAPCLGHGGHVYTYEGPQFGAQTVEEPCDECGGWHERHRVIPPGVSGQ